MSDITKVIRALFDAHLTIRINEGTWGPNFKIEIPADDLVLRKKLESVKAIVDAIPLLSIQQDSKTWIEFVYKLADLEEAEKAIKEKTRNYPLSILPIGKLVAKETSMEQDAAHAARAYIVSKLVENSSRVYEKVKKDLSDRKAALKDEVNVIENSKGFIPEHLAAKQAELADANKKFNALVGAESDEFHEKVFFPRDIRKRDVRKDQDNKPLSEDTFAAFCANAISGQRKTINLDKLINQAAAPATPAAATSSTSTATAQPAASVTTTSAAMFTTSSTTPLNPPLNPEIIEFPSTVTGNKIHNTRSRTKNL
jgi:hypothetical protein